MKKNDWILAGAVILSAAAFLLWHVLKAEDPSARIQIQRDGKVYGTYALDKDQEIPVGDTNVLTIRDGKAKMTEADCPDQICVHQKAISKQGESIVCLPNRIVVEVVKGSYNELDAVAN